MLAVTLKYLPATSSRNIRVTLALFKSFRSETSKNRCVDGTMHEALFKWKKELLNAIQFLKLDNCLTTVLAHM